MIRSLAALASCVAAAPLLLAQGGPAGRVEAADVQLQFADLLLADARYPEAADAYRRALSSGPHGARAGTGLVITHLRRGSFPDAHRDASELRARYPDSPAVAAVHGDALWAFGHFDDAEAAYEVALDADPLHARARHGRARGLAARSRLEEGAREARESLRLNPRDPDVHYTLAAILVRMHRFDEAALAFRSYVNLLPNRDASEKAAWARAEIRFLDSFKGRTPVEIAATDLDRAWRLPIRIEGDKALVRARVNGGPAQDFILDTGAEQTVISRDEARRRGVVPITYVQTAGVGEVGMRGLQVGRLDTLEIGGLKIRHVPCLIKNPPLSGLPGREPESLSPLALGLSMRVDYARRELLISRRLPADERGTELPLRMHRLAMVMGKVNDLHTAFVVDTGGEVISISQSTAGIIQPSPAFRRIPLKVYGTSGWDKDAFLMPGVDLAFSSIKIERTPVVVLNLNAPSVLLGLQLGGIVGHRFLSKYTLAIDLERSVVRLNP
jgi:tetratricopeptide (TPR) repeat protein